MFQSPLAVTDMYSFPEGDVTAVFLGTSLATESVLPPPGAVPSSSSHETARVNSTRNEQTRLIMRFIGLFLPKGVPGKAGHPSWQMNGDTIRISV
jgi:hypothetical protein